MFSRIAALSYCADDFFSNRRDDGVAQPAQSVCPVGYPMSHSTHAGFSEPFAFSPPLTMLTSEGSFRLASLGALVPLCK